MKIAVIGSGESGTGAALLAKKMGFDVFVSDGGKINDKYKQILIDNDVSFEEGKHSLEDICNVGLVLKSPGVPEVSLVMTTIRNAGIEVISEIEFASRYYKGIVIAITGSNGKTTTSGLFYHVLKSAGKDVMIGGNYGESFAEILVNHHPDFLVLEVSSFQLDDIKSFRPHVAILLNITPDHLDRYEYKFENYAASKFKINENQSADDFFIYNDDDEGINTFISNYSINGKQIKVSKENFEKGIPSKDGNYFEMTLKGKHNFFNAACVVEGCRILGLTEEEIQKGLLSFKNLPHRLEPVAIINGVEIINDSKATNVDSVYYALDAMDKPVVWIAGGTDKGNDYAPIKDLVQSKVKALVCMGLDNEKLKTFFKDIVPVIQEVDNVHNAVKLSKALANEGDVILLSPACASFDLFQNYMDRGDKFKKAIFDLI